MRERGVGARPEAQGALAGRIRAAETKKLSTLDEALLQPKVRRQLSALIEGSFAERSVNVLAFGLPGRDKKHFLAALGRELILRHSKRVLFRPAFKLVGQF